MPIRILRSSMKKFLFLAVLSFGAEAACDYSASQNVCAANFQCAERALKAGEDMDAYVAFSQKNACGDELKFASLFASIDGEMEEVTYETAKTDLPVIQDAPTRLPASVE